MKKTGHYEIGTATVFTSQPVDAERVFLAGTFNDWNPEATPMTRTKDGTWQVALDLAPGRYEYKFVVDGNWCCEAGRDDWAGCPKCVRDDSGLQCASCIANGLGTMNRLVEVRAKDAMRAGQAA